VGIIDFALPQALSMTFYAQYGLWIIFMLFGISGLIIGGELMRRRRA
jgi:apolipoprotein N-acyltransferase